MLHIYKASAGSGKTFRLAYQYILFLLGYRDESTGRFRLYRKGRDAHRNILAITFTNKATEEMKRRIVHELAVLAGMEPGWERESPYASDLCAAFGCDGSALREAARDALYRLLFDFNFFHVSTIDSFFQVILRTFAREAELSGNYELELDRRYTIGVGVDEMLSDLNRFDGSRHEARSRRHLTEWLVSYLLTRVDEGKSISLFNRTSALHSELIGFIDSLSDEKFMMHYDAMMHYLSDDDRVLQLRDAIADRIDHFRVRIRRACEEALALYASSGLADFEMTTNVVSALRKWAASISHSKLPATLIKCIDNPVTVYSGTYRRRKNFNRFPDLEEKVAEAAAFILDYFPQSELLWRTSRNLFVLGLMSRVYAKVERYRSEKNCLLLSDTNALLKRIIGDDDTPFVYERVGVWFRHFLIDEFQDTSRLQWENLMPLLREGMASDTDSLIIGDEKQCIYRFRSSDPTLLQREVEAAFNGRTEVYGNTPSENTNWRSASDVVLFNNALFSALASACGFDDIYANVSQGVSPKHVTHHGYVVMNGIDASTSDEFRTAALDRMLAEMRRQLAAGYLPGEICVLTRSRKEATMVIDHIMRQSDTDSLLAHMRIISDDAMIVSSSPSVRLVVSVLRAIAAAGSGSSDDAGDASGRRRRDGRRIADMLHRFELNYSLTHDASSSLRDAVAGSASADGSADRRADCLNLPSTVESIIARYVSPDARQEENMYISAFQDLVLDFTSRNASDLFSFLNWWDTTGSNFKVSSPDDEHALRVMTIHKSKGLEFKCVHIPFASWNLCKFESLEWFSTEGMPSFSDEVPLPPLLPYVPASWMESTPLAPQYAHRCAEQTLDELNVAYVAFTRAVKEIVASYNISDRGTTLGGILAGVVPELPGAGVSENGAVIFGSPTLPGKRAEAERTAIDPESVVEMRPYKADMHTDLWDDTVIESTLAERESISESRESGSVMHDVMAHVRYPSDLDKAIARIVRRGALSVDEAAAITEKLRAELSRDEVLPWFSGFTRLMREREIVDGDRTLRPDRVVWTEQGTVDVIDYKFGKQHRKSYLRQVREYMMRLEQAGYGNVRGFVWYLDSSEIVEVSADR